MDSATPPQASDTAQPFAPRTLRDAFGCFATGVTVVTGRGTDGVSVGLTANSFTSLSLDPPLLLFCPAKSASALPALRETKRFAINVLHRDSESVANRFATRNVDRFADAVWEDWDGLPILGDALASFACTLHAEHDGGDHIIMVGRIDRLRFEHVRDPLLYVKGRYRQVDAPQ
jgi:flavin reductase (DIM6/NTAB) family NADH-FMN oxidoreductase RutF